MIDKLENPPAFPVSWPDASPTMGMSLRDYFAGQALEGILTTNPQGLSTADLAKEAYQYADAMLKARKAND